VGAEPPSRVLEPGARAVGRLGARFRVRWAADEADVAATQRLRHLCFVEAAGGRQRPGGRDADRFDALCRHAMVEDLGTGRLVASFRAMLFPSGLAVRDSYSAQFYGLERLARIEAPLVEVGRFCVHPECRDADVLRLAWGHLTRLVDEAGVGLLFGCSSFAGTDPAPYAEALALLAEAHRAPDALAPEVKAGEVVRLSAGKAVDRRRAMAVMPPLLRTYLGMGGWVSDHAVVDRDLGTLHVFTGVEIAAIPPARARALRAVAEAVG